VFRNRTHVGIFVDDAPGPIGRVEALVAHLRSQVTVLSTADLRDAPLGDALRLRLPTPAATPSESGTRHGVPRHPDLPATVAPSLGPEGAAELVAWLEQEDPELLLVDGPSDVTLFARLVGVPVVALRRHGRRSPAQRQLIDRTVVGSLAPYPRELDGADDEDRRTVHAGLLSRFAGRVPDRAGARATLGVDAEQPLVTVVCGQDGLAVAGEELLAAGAATTGWRWHLLGRCGAAQLDTPPNVHRFGWVPDPWPHLAAADVVVAGASPSTVAEVADAGVPLIVVPRPSRDHEERRFADALGARGAALPLGTWPAADRWSATLDAAAGMDPSPLTACRDHGSARRAAEWLDTWAAMPPTAVTHEPLVSEELEVLLDLERAAARPGSPATR
jgi:UDP-N-acetylglucosamine--N-acetylmuramyl-(pentapeptide) pyrophosphoryl-undecaprenol N-acetylglucosamine transferase